MGKKLVKMDTEGDFIKDTEWLDLLQKIDNYM